MWLLQSQLFGILAIIAGVLVPLAFAQSTTAQPAIKYGNGFEGGLTGTNIVQSLPVFTTTAYQTIEFAVRTGVVVVAVGMYHNSTILARDTLSATHISIVKPPGSSPATIAAPITTSPGQGIQGAANRRADTTSSPTTHTLTVSIPDTLAVEPTVTVSFNSADIVNSNFNEVVYFQVNWTDTIIRRNGSTDSQNMVYVAFDDPKNDAAAMSLVPPTYPSEIETTYMSEAVATSSAAASLSSLGILPPSTSTSSTSASSFTTKTRGKKRLGGGAIAGIVIGILAILAILGAAIFFLIRRRSNAGAGGLPGSASPYRGSGSEQIRLQSGFASAAVTEKDGFGGGAHGGAHSPYTDDDGVGGAAGAGAARAVPEALPKAAAAHAANYPTPASSVSAPAKPAVSGQVAALIEDHMTPEDVARLAAEEEELDAAIAEAHQSRQASQARP